MRGTVLAACALLAAVLAAAPAAAQQSRLADQSVRGWKRICVYEMLMPVAGPSEGRRRSLEVGRGEPCPPRYSPPSRRPAAAARPPRTPSPRS